MNVYTTSSIEMVVLIIVMLHVMVETAYVTNVHAWLPDNMFCFSSSSSSQEFGSPFDLHQPNLSTTLQRYS